VHVEARPKKGEVGELKKKSAVIFLHHYSNISFNNNVFNSTHAVCVQSTLSSVDFWFENSACLSWYHWRPHDVFTWRVIRRV